MVKHGWLVVSNMTGLFSISYMGCHPSKVLVRSGPSLSLPFDHHLSGCFVVGTRGSLSTLHLPLLFTAVHSADQLGDRQYTFGCSVGVCINRIQVALVRFFPFALAFQVFVCPTWHLTTSCYNFSGSAVCRTLNFGWTTPCAGLVPIFLASAGVPNTWVFTIGVSSRSFSLAHF